MRKIFAIAAATMLSAFLCSAVFAATSQDAATPQGDEKCKEQTADQAASSQSPAPSSPAGLSKRNKAKMELEQQKALRQDTILQERAAETASQPQK